MSCVWYLRKWCWQGHMQNTVRCVNWWWNTILEFLQPINHKFKSDPAMCSRIHVVNRSAKRKILLHFNKCAISWLSGSGMECIWIWSIILESSLPIRDSRSIVGRWIIGCPNPSMIPCWGWECLLHFTSTFRPYTHHLIHQSACHWQILELC